MRSELENIKQIEDYLLDKLDPAAKKEFESRMSSDAAFKKEVEQQSRLIQRIGELGWKQEIQSAHKRNVKGGSSFGFKAGLTISLTIVITLLVYFYNFSEKSQIPTQTQIAEKIIQPPLPQADVPFTIETIDVEQENILEYASGTVLIIPSFAFLDSSGNEVKGEVEIKFREFQDATDLYLSGIPMDFTMEDGNEYPFESAAMCEIYALREGKELKLKTDKTIDIAQSTYTTSEAFNLYRFDKKKGKWEQKGKDIAIAQVVPAKQEPLLDSNVEEGTLLDNLTEEEVDFDNERPTMIKPVKADPYKLNFNIDYEENEFPELVEFENVSFELDKKLSDFKEGDNEIEWEDVAISRGEIEGTYIVQFSKTTTKQKRRYVVYPVFAEENYKQAKRIYDRKLKKYNNKRKIRQNEESRSIALQMKEQRAAEKRNQYMDSLNKMIESRNLIIKERNTKIELRNSQRLASNRRIDSLNKIRKARFLEKRDSIRDAYAAREKLNRKKWDSLEQVSAKIQAKERISRAKRLEELRKRNADLLEAQKERISEINETAIINQEYEGGLKRLYSINQFGIWNSDCPTNMPTGAKLSATFTYKDSPFTKVVLVDKDIRSLYNYYLRDFKWFQYNPKSNNLIWAVIDRKVVYFNDFDALPTNLNANYTFKMKDLEAASNNYYDIKIALNEL